MQKLPFSLTVRGDSPYYYVRFRNERTNRFMSWVSTKEKNYNRALRKAWDMYNQKSSELDKLSFYDQVHKSEYTKEDVLLFLEDFKKKGFISSYVLKDSDFMNSQALEWFCNFWDPNKSVYLQDKKRKGQSVHIKHRENSEAFILRYWTDILKNKTLGELTRDDIQLQFTKLDKLPLSGNTKNHILRAVLTPLKWAYNRELMERDLSKGWTFYKCEYKKRTILTMEMARNVFRVPWDNQIARLASMLAMCTGMRCGEIQALTLDDLGDNCIYVRHSYNLKDGMKSTKNGDERKVFVFFPYIMEELKRLGTSNPHVNGAGFIFWGKLPDKPIDCNVFRKFFRRALVLAGMDKEAAQKITFHAWRHFYTTYMADKVNQKALQSQTGHKTQIMLEHYAEHQTQEDAVRIMSAQKEIFSSLVN